MTDDAADLALLEGGRLVPVRVAPLNDYQAVCLFLDQHGVSRGACRSIAVCTLYRLYQGWQEGQPEGVVRVRPFSFAKQLRRMGLQKRHDGNEGEGARGRRGRARVDSDEMVLLVNKPGATFLRAWRMTHPDTPEYRKWFRRFFERDKRVIT